MSAQSVKLTRPGTPLSASELDAVLAMASHSGWKPSRWHDGEPQFDSPFGDDDLRVLMVVARVLGAQCVSCVAVEPVRRAPIRAGGLGPVTQLLVVMGAGLVLLGFVDGLAHHSGAAALALLGALAAAYGRSRRGARLTR